MRERVCYLHVSTIFDKSIESMQAVESHCVCAKHNTSCIYMYMYMYIHVHVHVYTRRSLLQKAKLELAIKHWSQD